MTGQPTAVREHHLALIAAKRRAEERYAESPRGMLITAAELRRAASEMGDSNDRDAMLRVAAGYEQRANRASRRPMP